MAAVNTSTGGNNGNGYGSATAAAAVYAAVARQFVMTLNGSMLYGCDHPNTARNAATLCDTINAALANRDMITVISNNGTLIIEDWPLDREFNIAKLLKHFEQIGLVSVSFERGLTPGAMIQFVGLAGDINHVEICKAGILDAKTWGTIDKVRINYVLYGKIKADEVVVKDSHDVRAVASGARAVSAGQEIAAMTATLSGTSNITAGNLSSRAAAEIEQVLTLASLLEKPKAVSEILSRSDTAAIPVSELQDAFGKIKSEIDGSPARGVDELLSSLYELKKDLYEAIEVQKTTGKMMRSAAVINNELNDLTVRALVKLIKDEYNSGKTPLNRLAHAIKRMIPANTELMHVLPRLKEMLLAEGMPLCDYLELVKTLGIRIDGEDLADSLKDAAESMGASVGDLVSAIRSKPEEAARLILLAAEIRQNLGDDELPKMLTNYIEDVCSKMAAEKCTAEGAGGAALKKVLAQLETQMFDQLSKQGLSKSVLDNVKIMLNRHIDGVNNAANTGANESDAKPPNINTKHGKLKMPAGALSANNLLFLINKEIKRNLRYKTQFATITVSVDWVITEDGTRRPAPEENAELIPQLFTAVEALLRDVDLIGIIGADVSPELFLVLPMTGDEGTTIVKERIATKTAAALFTLGSQNVRVVVRVSATFPDEGTTDLKSYLALSRENHNNC